MTVSPGSPPYPASAPAIAPERLRAGIRVDQVLRSGRRVAVGTVAIHALPADHDVVRATAVASRRVGIAVVRNRAKRLLREAARRLPWRTGLDLVVVARPSIVGATCDLVTADLRAAAARGDLLVGAAPSRGGTP